MKLYCRNIVRNVAVLSSCVLFGLAGCFSGSKSASNSEKRVGVAPSLTLALPTTLAGTPVTTPRAIHAAQGAPNCSLDLPTDAFGNGYSMTRFLIGLSQSQSCLADFVIDFMMATGAPYLNKGKIATNIVDAGFPKYIDLVQTSLGYQMWLNFDSTDTQMLYMAWTGTSASEATGTMVIRGIPPNGNDPSAPTRVRVDFVRSAAQDVNDVYFGFSDTHSYHATGFHVRVARSGSGAATEYVAAGLMEFSAAFNLIGSTLPGETFAVPEIKMVALANADAAGAAMMQATNMAMDLESDTADFGDYQFDWEDKTYFDAAGSTLWRARTSIGAHYVNTSGTNLRGGTSLDFILGCYESAAGCDVDNNGTIEHIPGMNVGAGYFADTCNTDDGADCTAFVQGLFSAGFLDQASNSDPVDEPSAPTVSLDAALTSAWPNGQDATTTFDIPMP